MSLQVLVAQTADPELQYEQLDEYLGIATAFEAPFNLYVKLADVGGNSNINFLVYSSGSQSVLAWGEYDTRNRSFELYESCSARASLLAPLTRELPSRGYEYVANSVRDRITEYMSTRPPVLDQDTYEKVKYALAVVDGEITPAQAEARFLDFNLEAWWASWFQQEYLTSDENEAQARESFLQQRRDEVAEYEERLNRTDLDRDVLRLAEQQAQLIQQVVNDFGTWLQHTSLNRPRTTRGLEQCLTREECNQNDDSRCSVYTWGEEVDLR
jgi:hypothetical protein